MVNMLEYINGKGEILQINQQEVQTKEGRERIHEHMRETEERIARTLEMNQESVAHEG